MLAARVASPRLLSPRDLEDEALVLPVLNSLLAAGAGGPGQEAAAALLQGMTPSPKALAVLLAALEVWGSWDWIRLRIRLWGLILGRPKGAETLTLQSTTS